MTETFEILNGDTYMYEPPDSERYIDCFDLHVAEIYHGYAYSENEETLMYFGIGYELDCDMSEENIAETFERYEGKADSVRITEPKGGIFDLRAELRNDKTFWIQYLKRIDEYELLSCELHTDLKIPLEGIIKDFEKFAASCKNLST